MDTSLARNRHRVERYSRTMPMAVLGGVAVCYERGTPVNTYWVLG